MKKIALTSAVAIASIFIATDIQAQQIEMIVEDVNPVYKTVQKYEDVPHTETVCYRYQRNSEGFLEKVVDNGFGSTGGLIGAGVGVVTHRQRPATASGTVFVNLEDETGLINVIVSNGCWLRFRSILRSETALTVTGRLERHEGVVNVIAERIETLSVGSTIASRDFR